MVGRSAAGAEPSLLRACSRRSGARAAPGGRARRRGGAASVAGRLRTAGGRAGTRRSRRALGVRQHEHPAGALRGDFPSALGFRAGRGQVAGAAQGEERGGAGVPDHRGGQRPGPPLRPGVCPAPGAAGAVGHQYAEQRGDGGHGAPHLPGDGRGGRRPQR